MSALTTFETHPQMSALASAKQEKEITTTSELPYLSLPLHFLLLRFCREMKLHPENGGEWFTENVSSVGK